LSSRGKAVASALKSKKENRNVKAHFPALISLPRIYAGIDKPKAEMIGVTKQNTLKYPLKFSKDSFILQNMKKRNDFIPILHYTGNAQPAPNNKTTPKGLSGKVPYAFFLSSITLNLLIIVSIASLPVLAGIMVVLSSILEILAIVLSIYVLLNKSSIDKGYALGILIAYAIAITIVLIFKPAIPY